jgi:hypothetical protein
MSISVTLPVLVMLYEGPFDGASQVENLAIVDGQPVEMITREGMIYHLDAYWRRRGTPYQAKYFFSYPGRPEAQSSPDVFDTA